MNGFTFWKSYHDILKRLNTRQRGEFITKICEFIFENKEPVFTQKEEKLEIAWLGIEANLIKSKNKSNRNQIETK